MSLTSDLRSYADSAVHQGKQTLSTARAQFSGVTDRAEGMVATLKRDPRFGKLFETAESLSTVVIETVQARVVKPVRSLTRPSE